MCNVKAIEKLLLRDSCLINSVRNGNAKHST